MKIGNYVRLESFVCQKLLSYQEVKEFSGQEQHVIDRAIADKTLMSNSSGNFLASDIAGWVEQLRFSLFQGIDSFWYKFLRDGEITYPAYAPKKVIDFFNEFLDTDLLPKFSKPHENNFAGYEYQTNGELVLERLNQLFLFPEIWEKIKGQEFIHEIAKNIYPDSYCIYNIRIILKTPFVKPLILHRDRAWVSSGIRKDPIVWVMVNLTDALDSDKDVRVLKGSQRLQEKHMTTERDISKFSFANDFSSGAIRILNSGTLHGTSLNTSCNTRRSLNIGLVSAEEAYKTKSPSIMLGRKNIF